MCLPVKLIQVDSESPGQLPEFAVSASRSVLLDQQPAHLGRPRALVLVCLFELLGHDYGRHPRTVRTSIVVETARCGLMSAGMNCSTDQPRRIAALCFA